MKYAKFVNEKKIEVAPVNKGAVSNYDKSVELMAADGYQPVIVVEAVSAEKPLIRYRQGDGHIEQYAEAAPVVEEPAEVKENQARSFRNSLLDLTDWTQLNDAPLSVDEKERYKAYRQYLRDIPEQTGFPDVEIKTFDEWAKN